MSYAESPTPTARRFDAPKTDRATTSPARGTEGSGGDRTVLALPARLGARLRSSVWLPLVGKTTGAVIGMVTLAAVGAASTLADRGVTPAEAPPHTEAALGGVWLAPSPKPVRPLEPATVSRQAAHPSPGAPGLQSSSAPPGREEKRPTAPVPRAFDPSMADPPEQAGNTPPDEHGGPAESKPAPGITTDGKVILNTASEVEFRRLPRVGPKRARAIVELRDRLGRFRRPTDLLRVKGIGVKTLRKMLPHLVVDPPETNARP